MATRLRVKRKKQRRDRLTAYQKGEWPILHKTSVELSRRTKFRKINRA